MNKSIEYLQMMVEINKWDYNVQRLDDARPVEVVPIAEVFTSKEITFIKRCVHPKAKYCYENSFKLSNMFPDRVKYVEGIATSLVPADHAFNKIGDKYVDITYELALGLDVKQIDYCVLLEVGSRDAYRAFLEEGVYCNLYDLTFRNRMAPRSSANNTGPGNNT